MVATLVIGKDSLLKSKGLLKPSTKLNLDWNLLLLVLLLLFLTLFLLLFLTLFLADPPEWAFNKDVVQQKMLNNNDISCSFQQWIRRMWAC